jgi:hypothetical protein
MSRCSGWRCRNLGSGYEKSSAGESEGAKELNARMAELMAARDAQDAKIWSRAPAEVKIGAAEPKQETKPSNQVVLYK